MNITSSAFSMTEEYMNSISSAFSMTVKFRPVLKVMPRGIFTTSLVNIYYKHYPGFANVMLGCLFYYFMGDIAQDRTSFDFFRYLVKYL